MTRDKRVFDPRLVSCHRRLRRSMRRVGLVKPAADGLSRIARTFFDGVARPSRATGADVVGRGGGGTTFGGGACARTNECGTNARGGGGSAGTRGASSTSMSPSGLIVRVGAMKPTT